MMGEGPETSLPCTVNPNGIRWQGQKIRGQGQKIRGQGQKFRGQGPKISWARPKLSKRTLHTKF